MCAALDTYRGAFSYDRNQKCYVTTGALLYTRNVPDRKNLVSIAALHGTVVNSSETVVDHSEHQEYLEALLR